jgi:hypothetical protein
VCAAAFDDVWVDPTHSFLVWCVAEVVHAGKDSDGWIKDHNLRLLLDRLVRVLFLIRPRPAPRAALLSAAPAPSPYASPAWNAGGGGLYHPLDSKQPSQQHRRTSSSQATFAALPVPPRPDRPDRKSFSSASPIAVTGMGMGMGAGAPPPPPYEAPNEPDPVPYHQLSAFMDQFLSEQAMARPGKVYGSNASDGKQAKVGTESPLIASATNFSSSDVEHFGWLSFYVLLLEANAEREGWVRLGRLLMSFDASKKLRSQLRAAGVTEPMRKGALVLRW